MAKTLPVLLPLALIVGAAYGEIEIIDGPGENSTRVCNESWVAWRNNSRPFYAQFVHSRTYYDVEFNGTLLNITVQYDVIQVLEGSMPIIPIVYFEEGENGTRGRPVICRNPPTSAHVDDTALVIVIYITSSLAIIASLVALVTYMLLEKLRTLPGLVNMNLFLAFLLGDIMLQIRIGFEYNGTRHIVNYVLFQGLLIARFVWMSLTGFEMCRSLYRGIRMIGGSLRYEKRLMITIYMVIGWGTAIALTLVMVVVEETSNSSKVKRLFGVFGYISNLLPIAVSQLINISVVVFISFVIFNASRRQRRLNESSYKKQNVNFVRLFLILLSVLGLVWILCFILVLLPEADARNLGVVITYAILTDTQPVFVCIAFICTPTVYRMFLVRFHIRTEADFRKSRRSGTMISTISERELHRGRSTMSRASDSDIRSLPLSERSFSAVHKVRKVMPQVSDSDFRNPSNSEKSLPATKEDGENDKECEILSNGTAIRTVTPTQEMTEQSPQDETRAQHHNPAVISNGSPHNDMVDAIAGNALPAGDSPSLTSSNGTLNP